MQDHELLTDMLKLQNQLLQVEAAILAKEESTGQVAFLRVLQSVREGRWTHGLLLKTSPSHEMEAVFFSLGGAPLVGESAVRPLFGLVVPSSALGETWRAPSQARNVLMARENPRERRRARGGVKQLSSTT